MKAESTKKAVLSAVPSIKNEEIQLKAFEDTSGIFQILAFVDGKAKQIFNNLDGDKYTPGTPALVAQEVKGLFT